MKLLSWNVNGIRAAEKKGFLKWLAQSSADIVCLQETKALPEQLSEALLRPDGYTSYWNSAERKGYSGVSVFTKHKPIDVKKGLGIKRFDVEGRVLEVEFKDFTLFNIYFPNGKRDDERLKYKLDFYDASLGYFKKLVKAGKRLVICGDVNTAHKPIDLARPKENEAISGFLPIEREWMDRLVKDGFIDTFRLFCADSGHYSWWDMQSRARERNVGWRIDYFFVSESLKPAVKDAFILSDVMGSDHCPVGVTLKV